MRVEVHKGIGKAISLAGYDGVNVVPFKKDAGWAMDEARTPGYGMLLALCESTVRGLCRSCLVSLQNNGL